jgi:hypothetical protein
MALTPIELEQWVSNKLDVSVEPDWGDQDIVSKSQSLHIKFDSQLAQMEAMYSKKIQPHVDVYADVLKQLTDLVTGVNISAISLKGRGGYFDGKVKRMAEHLLAVRREIEGRQKGWFTRNPIGTTYYIDPTNGNDAAPHDGLRHPTTSTYTADSGTNTTTLVETSELPRTTDDDWNGAYLYNVTRGIGVLITDSAYAAGTWTLTHPSITGQVSGDTYFIIDAWATMNQYSNNARSAGDIAYVRANTTETNSGINWQFASSGDEDAPIYIIGCDSTVNDPWNDGSDVKPVYNFNTGAYQLTMYSDDHWWFERLDIRNSTHPNEMIGTETSLQTNWKACVFRDYSSSGDPAFYAGGGTRVIIDSCEFRNNLSFCLRCDGSPVYVYNSTFDGLDTPNNESGVNSRTGGFIFLDTCQLGQTTVFDGYDFSLTSGGHICLFNTVHNTPTLSQNEAYNSYMWSEDDDGVYGVHKGVTSPGYVDKETTEIRPGGGSSSIKMTSDQQCGLFFPLHLSIGEDTGEFSPFWRYKFWMRPSQHTITMYFKELGGWTTLPDAAQLYMEVSYLSNSASAARTKLKSTEVMSDISTTVDADSSNGQKVLNVAATAGFAVGDQIRINDGGARDEQGVVASIQAGVSLTLEENLVYTHTAAQADAVYKEWFAFTVTFTPQREGYVYLNVFLRDYEPNRGCYIDAKPVVS